MAVTSADVTWSAGDRCHSDWRLLWSSWSRPAGCRARAGPAGRGAGADRPGADWPAVAVGPGQTVGPWGQDGLAWSRLAGCGCGAGEDRRAVGPGQIVGPWGL